MGDGTIDEMKKGRKKIGKTWGKIKRATGIKKNSTSSSHAPFDSSSAAGIPFPNNNAAANNTFQRLKVSSNYNENLQTLTNFYNIYNPEKVSESKAILDAYRGKEVRGSMKQLPTAVHLTNSS